jgi:hypothetical protein
VREDAALEIGLEFVLDERRQGLACTMRSYPGGKRLTLRPHQLVERRLFGAAALVLRCAGGAGALCCCAHG